ncbi:unnamed protein product [Closterium sp. NIES-64]|nr:unnamed protein product [Closterium sp. NIES-64]
MERSFGERAQEMDPEELRLARQRVADLIRAGDDVEQCMGCWVHGMLGAWDAGWVHGMLGGCMGCWVGAWDAGWVHGMLGGCMGCWVGAWDAGWVHGMLGGCMGCWVGAWMLGGCMGCWVGAWDAGLGPWFGAWDAGLVHGMLGGCMGCWVGAWMLGGAWDAGLVHGMLGWEGALNDALVLVIQNRLNFARHDAEREAQQATPALRLLNTLLHLADDLSADISTSGYDQWQREARDAMRAVFLPEDPFTVVMPMVNGTDAPSASAPWNDLGGTADLGASMGGESTLLRIDFIRELEELLEIVEADATAAAEVITETFNFPLDGPTELEVNGNTVIEEDGGSWGNLDADRVALKLRLEERFRIISRVRDLQRIAATLNL